MGRFEFQKRQDKAQIILLVSQLFSIFAKYSDKNLVI